MNVAARLRKFPFWSWLWFGLGALYFILQLLATFEFSVSWDPADPLKAYTRVFQERDFWETFLYSNLLAVATILMNIILIVPTAYWIRLRVPEARRLVEFLTLLPFVVPAIILVFGLIGVYSAPIQVPFSDVTLLKPLTTFKFGIYGAGHAIHVSFRGYGHAHRGRPHTDRSGAEPGRQLAYDHHARDPA